MAIIISYDITAKHTEFKDRMKDKGYKDVIKGIENCDKIYFPNTTLYHPTKTASQAVADARNLCKELNINLERCIATKWEGWYAICGEPFN